MCEPWRLSYSALLSRMQTEFKYVTEYPNNQQRFLEYGKLT